MTEKPNDTNESLLKFPCDFTIKIFGLNSDEFEAEVLMIVHKHIANLSDRAVQSRLSENGKYKALNISVHLNSREQLDNLYRELSSSKHVLMAL